MKRLKLASFIAVLAFGLFSALAFNTKPAETGKFNTVYYYSGDPEDIDEVRDPANWSTSGTACNVSGSKICTISSALNEADFDDHVEAFPTIAQALSECNTKRN